MSFKARKGALKAYVNGKEIDLGILTVTGVEVETDDALSTTSDNPVKNKVITNAINSLKNENEKAAVVSNSTDETVTFMWGDGDGTGRNHALTLNSFTDAYKEKVDAIGDGSSAVKLEYGTATLSDVVNAWPDCYLVVHNQGTNNAFDFIAVPFSNYTTGSSYTFVTSKANGVFIYTIGSSGWSSKEYLLANKSTVPTKATYANGSLAFENSDASELFSVKVSGSGGSSDAEDITYDSTAESHTEGSVAYELASQSESIAKIPASAEYTTSGEDRFIFRNSDDEVLFQVPYSENFNLSTYGESTSSETRANWPNCMLYVPSAYDSSTGKMSTDHYAVPYSSDTYYTRFVYASPSCIEVYVVSKDDEWTTSTYSLIRKENVPSQATYSDGTITFQNSDGTELFSVETGFGGVDAALTSLEGVI